MSRWFRHYAGMMSDPKFGGVARFCKRSRAEVLFVWGCLLESASEYDSAVYSWDADAMAELLGIETEHAQAIHDALVEKGLLAGGRILSWERRQFKSDDSAERVRKHRSAKKAVTDQRTNDDVTVCNGGVTLPETEAEPEADTTSVAKAPEVLPNPIAKTARKVRLKGDFAKFWAEYPLKVGKLKAERCYVTALGRCESDDPEAEILAGLLRCKPLWEAEFIPHASTWLNRGGWMDQPEPEAIDGGTGPPKFDLAEHDAWRRSVAQMAEDAA